MVKYLNSEIVFEEIPKEISLAINITNCQNRCPGCHSPYLRNDIGTELNEAELDGLIKASPGISCVLFMGEGNDIRSIEELSQYIHDKYKNLKTALYSGREETLIEPHVWDMFDYVKVGPYKKEFGPLNDPSTNQRLYMMFRYEPEPAEKTRVDITESFWKWNEEKIEEQQRF